MGCSSFIVRSLLFLFNFIFVVAGLALLVLGILTKLNLDEIVPEKYSGSIGTAPIMFITLGSIIFFISFLGCCGAIRKSSCMLTMYAVIILIILIVQITAGIIAFVNMKEFNEDFKVEIGKMLKNTIDEYNNKEYAREYMDLVQRNGQCCGAASYRDYPKEIPASCCKNNVDPCTKPFESGCTNFVYDEMRSATQTIGAVALGLACTEVLTIIFSLCLSSSIKNEQRRQHV